MSEVGLGVRASTSGAPATDRVEPATILVVDDDPMSRLLLAGNVRAEGHLTVEADSGEMALKILSANRVDVVLLDILMPGLDGFGVLARMKVEPALAKV